MQINKTCSRTINAEPIFNVDLSGDIFTSTKMSYLPLTKQTTTSNYLGQLLYKCTYRRVYLFATLVYNYNIFPNNSRRLGAEGVSLSVILSKAPGLEQHLHVCIALCFVVTYHYCTCGSCLIAPYC